MINEEKEVARYLNIAWEIPSDTLKTIQDMLVIAKTLTPQKRVATFAIKKTLSGIALDGTDIVLSGKLATKHFDSCTNIIALIATMGMPSELLLKKYFAQNSEKAVVLDACLTQQIESYLDLVEQELQNDMAPNLLTTRISCGYGDLALSHQKQLLTALRGDIIGVYLNDSYMLTPNKSVIALIGVKK